MLSEMHMRNIAQALLINTVGRIEIKESEELIFVLFIHCKKELWISSSTVKKISSNSTFEAARMPSQTVFPWSSKVSYESD